MALIIGNDYACFRNANYKINTTWSNATISPGTSTTATINAVDLDKTFVSVSSANGYRGSRYSITFVRSLYDERTSAGGSLT